MAIWFPMSRASLKFRCADCGGSPFPYNETEFGLKTGCPVTTSIVSLSEFKARAAQMLAEMKSSEQVVVLTQRGAASAVVQDYESHQRLQDALLMLKLMVQGEIDISAGRTTPQDEVFRYIRGQLTVGDG